ncbi:MAG: DoxX family membrane protein [Terracidiphilus sp.]
MKIAAIIARYLLGLIFLVFGLNKFLNFIPSGPLPPGVTGQFMMIMVSTKYLMMVGVFEGVGGLLLLFNRFVPLALALLAPVIVNILFVNIVMIPKGLPPAFVVTFCWGLVYWRHRAAFAPLFQQRMPE